MPALTGRSFYSNAAEGEHTLEAMLYNDGELKTASRTTATFALVNDPDIVGSSKDMPEAEQEQDQDITLNEEVQVLFPVVKVSSPAANVTYPGTSVSVRLMIEPTDAKILKHYFENAFVCINIDSAPAYSCFAIFDDNKFSPPLVLGLKNGIHTNEAALSHPETGELLPGSFSGTSIFFTSGEFAVDVTVSGDNYIIPIVEGSNCQCSNRCGLRGRGHGQESLMHRPNSSQALEGMGEESRRGNGTM